MEKSGKPPTFCGRPQFTPKTFPRDGHKTHDFLQFSGQLPLPPPQKEKLQLLLSGTMKPKS